MFLDARKSRGRNEGHGGADEGRLGEVEGDCLGVQAESAPDAGDG